jgi:hypothetical protein
MEYVIDDNKKLVILEMGVNPNNNIFLKNLKEKLMEHDQIT